MALNETNKITNEMAPYAILAGCPIQKILISVTKLEKWGHLYPMDIFLVKT